VERAQSHNQKDGFRELPRKRVIQSLVKGGVIYEIGEGELRYNLYPQDMDNHSPRPKKAVKIGP